MQRPAAPGRYPVLITQTPYSKSSLAGSVLGGGGGYLVSRGYVQVTVDVRGTGASQGTWDSFGEAEQRDDYDTVEWAAAQDWSNGNVGLDGPSYIAITQLTTAALHPPHLKAIFPVDPADFPHQLPTVPALLKRLGGKVSILTDPQHDSTIALPVVGTSCANPKVVKTVTYKKVKAKKKGAKARRKKVVRRTTVCDALPVPKLVRG